MPAIVTFDGPNKIITEISAGGDNELDVVEIYSEWKEWAQANTEFLAAFAVVGGDPITPVQNLGSTFFLENGWRIRPAELSHKLTLVGNLFTREAGQSVFVPTLGAFTVNTETRVSSLVDSSVSRLDLAQLLPAVYIDVVGGVAGTEAGIGTPTNPVNNIADARAIADRENLREYRINGDLALDQNYERWTFVGLASGRANELDLNGFSVNESSFSSLVLTGSLVGSIKANFCGLNLFSEIAGLFSNCGLMNNMSLQAGATIIMADCYSEVPGTATPVITMNGANLLSMRNYSGGVELLNMNDPGATVSVDLDPGTCVLGPTCTAGLINVRGTGLLKDTSSGTTVVTEALIQPGAAGGLTASQETALLTTRDHARAANAQTKT